MERGIAREVAYDVEQVVRIGASFFFISVFFFDF